MDLQTPVTVEVEESHQVIIFAIKEETGIVGFTAYASEVNVNIDPHGMLLADDGITLDDTGLRGEWNCSLCHVMNVLYTFRSSTCKYCCYCCPYSFLLIHYIDHIALAQ